MDKTLKFKTHWRSQVTPVHFGINFALNQKLPQILERTKLKTVVITDQFIEKLYGLQIDYLDLKVFSFTPGEAYKTRETKILLEDHMLSHNFSKDSLLIGLGGGVVSDMAGFLAATYCRGISLIQIPTSLMAMVDLSISNKNAVNTPYGKNMIGSFYPPEEVLIDGMFLSTLPQKQKNNGIVEIIKTALVASPLLFETMRDNVDKWQANDLPFIMKQIYESVLIKLDIVQEDPEEEKGVRRILNIGHTFGYALETLEEFSISTGEANAIGVLVSCFISHQMGFLSSDAFEEIENIFNLYKIPLKMRKEHSIDKWINTLARDKKSLKASPRLVLLKNIGEVCPFEGEYCTEVAFPLLEEAIAWMYQKFHQK